MAKPDAGAALDIDLTSVEHYRAGFPHELFTRLRHLGPVHRHRPLSLGGELRQVWAVVAHEEIQQANRDWEHFSAHEGQALAPLPERFRGNTMLSLDPPEHAQMRRLINAGFTPRMVRQLESRIAARTEQILDAAAERGTVDFVEEVAFQLPMHVVADIVGVPEADRPEVFRLTNRVMRALDPALGMSKEEARSAERALYAYAAELTAEKRAHPADDVWSILANGPLDPLEPLFLTLNGAGSETTSNALTIGLMALIDNPDQLAALSPEPDANAAATEEVLRWSSPVIAYARTAVRKVSLGGQEIAANDRVVLFYPSGNRDSAVFDDPFRFDVSRPENPHLAFGGGGPHFCLGAHLARVEIRVMLAALVRRFRGLAIVGDPEWMAIGPFSNVGVGVTSLRVRLDPR